MCIIYVIEGWECLLSNLYFLTTRIESQWLLTYDQVPTFREPWSWPSISHMTTWGPTKSKDTAIAMQLSETDRDNSKEENFKTWRKQRRMKQRTSCQIWRSRSTSQEDCEEKWTVQLHNSTWQRYSGTENNTTQHCTDKNNYLTF